MSRRKRPGDFGNVGLAGSTGYGNTFEAAALPVAASVPAPTRPFNVSSLAGECPGGSSAALALSHGLQWNYRRMGLEYSFVTVDERPLGSTGGEGLIVRIVAFGTL
jgi:hypothetical protein